MVAFGVDEEAHVGVEVAGGFADGADVCGVVSWGIGLGGTDWEGGGLPSSWPGREDIFPSRAFAFAAMEEDDLSHGGKRGIEEWGVRKR